jgi:hypothetical protein
MAALLGLCCLAVPVAADDNSSSSNGIRYENGDCEPKSVPEPSTLLASLLAAGAVGGAMFCRQRRRS